MADLDGDGFPEVLSIDWDVLKVYDGRTGELKARKQLPADNFAQVLIGLLKGDPKRPQVLVKVNSMSYPPYSYGNPTIMLDSDLSELWTQDFYGGGHNPVFIDVDGCNELLIGYNAFGRPEN